MQATKSGLVGGIGVLLLVASLLAPSVGAASLRGVIKLSGPVNIGGDSWTQVISAADGAASDSITISLSRRLPASPSYNLRETHTYVFPGLDASTVVVADNLTGSIEVEALDTGGLLAMSVDLVKVKGKTPTSHCGESLRRRVVNIAEGSTLSLNSLNTVFGELEALPETGRFRVERGECSRVHCKELSRALIGQSSRELLGGVEESLHWEKRDSFLQDETTLDVTLERELAPLGTVVGTTIVSIRGTLENGGVGKNATVFDGDGLPLLSGEAVLSNLGGVEKGPRVQCTPLISYRDEVSSGDQSGSLTFQPTGLTSVGLELPWTSSTGMREFVNWVELGPPLPPLKP